MGSMKPEPKSKGVAAFPSGSVAMVRLLLSSTVAADGINEISCYTSLSSGFGYPVIPVVMIADLMAEGDHDGYKLLTSAAIPVT